MSRRFSYLLFFPSAFIGSPANAEEGEWTGFYTGVYSGVNATSSDVQDYWCWATCGSLKLDRLAPSVGVTAGFNQQIGENLFLGLESEFGTGTKRRKEIRGTPTTPAAFVWTSNLEWQSAIRARAGIVLGKTTMYVSGGVALAKASLTEISDGSRYHGPGNTEAWGANWKGVAAGHAIGAGVEHKFAKLSAKIEVMQTVFNTKETCYVDLSGPNAGNCWDPALNYWAGESKVLYTPRFNSIRVGVNYHF